MGNVFSTNLIELESKIRQLQTTNTRLELRNKNMIKEHDQKYKNLKEEFRSYTSEEQEIIIQKDKEIELLQTEICNIKKQLKENQGIRNALTKIDDIIDQFGHS